MTEPLTKKSLARCLQEIAYSMDVTPGARHRISKEIAEELIASEGAFAHLYCIEKLSSNTQQPKLWRDVLAWIDELTKGERK